MLTETKKPAAHNVSENQALKNKASNQENQRGKTRFVPYQAVEGEAYMNEKQRAHFKQLLLQWKQELLGEISQTVGQLRSQAGRLPDLSDFASQEESFRGVLRMQDRNRKLIKKIEDTEQRLTHAHGEYGYCESCGNAIGIQRLEARPIAELCFDCKVLEEIREKQQGL